jgi:class 3 adenylate cyclase
LALCGKVREAERDYWHWVTKGEACLLLEELGSAESAFERARSRSDATAQQVDSTSRQLRLLAGAGVRIPRSVVELFRPPRVVAFVSGAEIEAPHWDRHEERLAELRLRLDGELAKLGDCIGYCAGLPGLDLTFAEAMLERGAELNLVLPMEVEEFQQAYVEPAGQRWRFRFRSVLREAHSVSVASRSGLSTDAWLRAQHQRVLRGRAWMRARELDATPTWIECSDGKGPIRVGTDIPREERLERVVSSAEPDASLAPERKSAMAGLGSSAPSNQPVLPPRFVATMLFGDLRGYSRLRDEHYSIFVDFSSAIREFMRSARPRPDFLRTTGDGLFAVCGSREEPGSALRLAEFASGLQQAIEIANQRAPMPDGKPMEMRVALNVGPIFAIDDPVTSLADYFGVNVNRTARLEPVTVPGQIYTTEPFAALLEYEQQRDPGSRFRARSEFVGDVELAKGYGIERVFVLREDDRRPSGSAGSR